MKSGKRTCKAAFAAAALACALGVAAGARSAPGTGSINPTGAHSIVSPAVVMGPQATPAIVSSGASYGLFTCQLGEVPGVTCYDPYQMRRAYGTDTLINKGFDGAGKTIVIIDAFQSPNIVSQLDALNSFYGLPSSSFTQIAPDGLTPFDPTNGDMVGWAVEISLDVEWAHAIAPGANIDLVLAKSDQDSDLLSAIEYAVDHHLGDIISQSFGENESCMDPKLVPQYHEVYAQATLKGITIFASSGDSGAAQATCDGSALVQAVSIPASDPLVTAVGGTELTAANYCLSALGCNPSHNPPAGTYEGEVAWNEAPQYGATGGGFSVLYAEPEYQEGVVHGGKQQRGVPDVAYNSAVDAGGVLTYLDIPGLDAGFYLVGGTSAGSPQWSALLAITDQIAVFDLGFVNDALYRIGRAPPIYGASLHDITIGNNSFEGVTGFNAAPGWDPTTGLGSPKASLLVFNLLLFHSPLDGLAEVALSAHEPGKVVTFGRQKPH
jgi:subtilase family serine protease